MKITIKQVCLRNLQDMLKICNLNIYLISGGFNLNKLILESLWNTFYINAYSLAEGLGIKDKLNPNNPFYIWCNVFDTMKHPGKVAQKTNYFNSLSEKEKLDFKQAFIPADRSKPDDYKKQLISFLFRKFTIPFIHLPAIIATGVTLIPKSDINYVLIWWKVLAAFVSYLIANYDKIWMMKIEDKSQLWKHFLKYVADNDPNYNKKTNPGS